MHRRNLLLTGIAIVGSLAGCSEDDIDTGGTDQAGDTDQPDGTEQTDTAGPDDGSTEEDGGTEEANETEQTSDGTTDLSGSETYSGTWSGSIGGTPHSGQWQFEADFDTGDVSGWFTGDGEGNISGTVSGGNIDAKGGAAFGTVVWSGEFSSNGQEISGTWELAEDIPGSGDWSGTVGELEARTETQTEAKVTEKPLPEEDKASGEEPIKRYPDSVMLSHSQATSEKGTLTTIDYGTSSSIDAVASWYKEELGNPAMAEDQGDKITLAYRFEGEEMAEITITEGDYTNIHLEYVVPQ